MGEDADLENNATVPHDLHFRRLFELLLGFKSISESLKSEVGRKLSAQLDIDVSQLRSLSQLPIAMSVLGDMWAQCLRDSAETWRDHIVDAKLKELLLHPKTPQQQVTGLKLSHKLMNGYARQLFSGLNKKAVTTPQSILSDIDVLLSASPQGHDVGLRFLSSLCVQAWTIFEVLAKQLWIDALNANPILGTVAVEHMGAGTDVEATALRPGKKGTICIPLEVLDKCKYNLSGSLGTYAEPKFNFQKIWKIKDAYQDVWPAAWGYEIDGIFNSDLQDLAAVRNAAVHRSGFVDGEFISQVKAGSPLKEFALNEPIPLNVTMVNRMAMAALTRCQELIRMVDRFLSGDQPAQPPQKK